MSELTAHIAALNAATLAWVAEDPSNRGAGLLVEDESFWASRGIHTVEECERSMAMQVYSDVYKENHGIRPRWVSFEGLSAAEINAMVDALYRDAESPEMKAVRDDLADAADAAAAGSDHLTFNPFGSLADLKS